MVTKTSANDTQVVDGRGVYLGSPSNGSDGGGVEDKSDEVGGAVIIVTAWDGVRSGFC